MSTNISPADLCKSAMSETLKEKVDKDVDLQQFINKILNIFLKYQQINTTYALTESCSTHQLLTQPRLPQQQTPKVVGIIQSTVLRNPDKSAQLVAARNSSFTPTFTPANELIGDAEDDD